MKTQTVLITGASSGIGEETTKLLLLKGYTVYAAARRVDRMKSLETIGAKILAMDVTDNESMERGVKTIEREQGGVDILINNAGYGSFGAIEDVSIDEARQQFEVNVFGLARLTQLVLPYMRNQRAGKIINISSIGGKIYEPLGGWYHSTKFAVEGLSDCLRLELKPFGINVVLIEPAAIRTEWGEIAAENMLKTSGNTAYKDMATKMAKLFSTAFSKNTASGPEAIAAKIWKAVKSDNPRTRYPAGKGAKLILTTRKLASDKMFDKIMSAALR